MIFVEKTKLYQYYQLTRLSTKTIDVGVTKGPQKCTLKG
jgi:hypothetical protein